MAGVLLCVVLFVTSFVLVDKNLGVAVAYHILGIKVKRKTEKPRRFLKNAAARRQNADA